MAYDPNFPPFHAEITSAEFRAQFQALKALIDAQGVLISSLSIQLADVPNQIAAAISATSSNSNGVGTLGLAIANNPTQPTDVQPIADKVDELINVLRR